MNRNERRRREREANQKPKPKTEYEQGKEDGVKMTTTFFLKRFKDFQNTDGVGYATMRKLVDTVGPRFFTEWDFTKEKKG